MILQVLQPPCGILQANRWVLSVAPHSCATCNPSLGSSQLDCLLVLEAGVKVTGGARFFDLVSKIGPFFGVHKQDIANKHMEKNHQRAWIIISCLDNFWNSSNTWYHMIFLMIYMMFPIDISMRYPPYDSCFDWACLVDHTWDSIPQDFPYGIFRLFPEFVEALEDTRPGRLT